MANLAIKGHATRGKEVIEILKMLGGKVYIEEIYKGEYPDRHYFINKNDGFIHTYFSETVDILNDFQTFTLEEFLKKFPYKVGDKVIYEGIPRTITKMVWEAQTNTVAYKLDDKLYCNVVNELQPYKEQETIKIDIPKGYEFVGVDDDKQQVVFEKIKLQYPKFYDECYEIMNIPENKLIQCGIYGYKANLLSKFQQLLICRDAYWKIAGDWKPSYMYNDLYCIGYNGNIVTWKMQGGHKQLTFPTEEMRDIFYENFKELIEECKELL